MIFLIFESLPPTDSTAIYQQFLEDKSRTEVMESNLEKIVDDALASLNGRMLNKSPFSLANVTELQDTIKYHVTFGNFPSDNQVYVVPVETGDMDIIQENLGGFYPARSFWSVLDPSHPLSTWRAAFEHLPTSTLLNYIPDYFDLTDGSFANGELHTVENYDEDALPIELGIFAANYDKKDRDINLCWETETEVNNSHFELYRNTIRNEQDLGRVFVGWIDGHGNSSSPKEYTFEDKTIKDFVVGDVLKYTLRQIDTDGRYEDFNLEVVIGNEALGSDYKLSQNYPNPFNPTTHINYEIHVNSTVDITVYDINGRVVKNVVNGKLEKGTYGIDIDLNNFSSGIYLLQMQVYGEDSQQVQLRNKMLLVK